MINILDFIDSPDVREYNRDTHFCPIEQAAIIYHSRQSVEAKLAAWRELLDSCTEEEFAAGTISGGWFFGGDVCETFTHRDIVADLVAYYETALELRSVQESNVFFELNITIPFRNLPDTITKKFYFSSYAKAIAHLQKYQAARKEEDEPDLLCAELRLISLDQPDSDSIATYYFDEELSLYDVGMLHGIADTSHDGDCHILNAVVYVPVPFVNGDLVKYTINGEVRYGILSESEEFSKRRPTLRNSSVFDYEVERYIFENSKWVFDYDDSVHATMLERCTEEELPDDQQMLKCLRDAIRGDVHYLHFLYCYSRDGNDLPKNQGW